MPRSRTAASSSARGIPSSLRHSSATAGGFCGLSAKSGTAARARSTNRVTASAYPAVASSAGSSSGVISTVCSSGRPRGERLVARMRSPGAADRSSAASSAQASVRCSQVSRISSSSCSARFFASTWGASPAASSGSPSASDTVRARSPGACSGDSWTSQQPSAKLSEASAAARSASRVLPTPPTPRSVTRRCRSMASAMAGNSRRLPMNRVTSAGRLSLRWPNVSAVTISLVWCGPPPGQLVASIWWCPGIVQRRPPAPAGKPPNRPRCYLTASLLDSGPGLCENRAEDLLHLVEVLLGADQRRGEVGHRVAAVVGAADESRVEQCVRQEPAQQPLGLVVVEGLLGGLVLDQFDAVEVAGAADVAHDRQVEELVERRAE